jgi:hypothetical protein
MAGFKRGGSRGTTFKKPSYTKKRSSPEDSETVPRASKKARADDDDEEDDVSTSTPLVPELKTDTEGNAYIGVCLQSCPQNRRWDEMR